MLENKVIPDNFKRKAPQICQMQSKTDLRGFIVLCTMEISNRKILPSAKFEQWRYKFITPEIGEVAYIGGEQPREFDAWWERME